MDTPRKKKRSYEEEAAKLLKAIDIAIETIEKYPSGFSCFNEHSSKLILKGYKDERLTNENKEAKYRNLGSLQYSITKVFTLFNEDAGPAVNYFWQRIKEEGLPYERKNILEIVLKRGKIRGRIEYDFIIDAMVPLVQQGGITEEQFKLLGEYVGQYESKKRQ